MEQATQEQRAVEVSEERVERAASLLDVRKIIGGLLGIYGLILLFAGILGSEADKEKAAGVNINLWVGLALLAACAIFWGWALTRPLTEELEEDKPDRPSSPAR